LLNDTEHEKVVVKTTYKSALETSLFLSPPKASSDSEMRNLEKLNQASDSAALEYMQG
jgi:hypothetical protein